jgi:hypothetical protein
MKMIPVYLSIAAIALLSGCNSMNVSFESTYDYDFRQAKTYQWIDAPADILAQHDTFLHENIQKALNNELAARGLNQVLSKPAADLQVAYYVKLKEQKEYTAPLSDDEREFSGGLVFDRNKKRWKYQERKKQVITYSAEMKTLVLLVYETQSAKPIWRGTLETKIDRNKPLEQQTRLITASAHRLMAEFPLKTPR